MVFPLRFISIDCVYQLGVPNPYRMLRKGGLREGREGVVEIMHKRTTPNIFKR